MLRGAILAAAAAAAAAAATAAAMSNAGDDDTRRSTRTARRQRKRGDSAHRFGHRSGGGSVAVAIRRPTGCSGAATDRGGDGASRPSSPLAVPTAHRLQSLIDSRYRRHDHHHRRHTPSSYGIFRSGSGGRRGGGGGLPPPHPALFAFGVHRHGVCIRHRHGPCLCQPPNALPLSTQLEPSRACGRHKPDRRLAACTGTRSRALAGSST